MEYYRKNNDVEKNMLFVYCKVPTIIKIFAIIICLIPFIAVISLGEGFLFALMTSAFAFLSYFLIICIPFLIITKGTYAVVTNKAIKGQIKKLFQKSSFTYKLDAITNIRIDSSFGVKQLVLEITQGNGGLPRVFVISYIRDADYVHSKLASILKSIKNDKDVIAKIQADKIKVEAKKAEAFEKIAEKVSTPKAVVTEKSVQKSSIDYIDELKKLKELLDSGIITKDEFELKKKKILE